MVLKDHIDQLEVWPGICLWKSMRKQVVSKSNFFLFFWALYFTRKRLQGFWHPHFHCIWTEGESRKSLESSERKVPLKEKCICLAVWWHKRECRTAKMCRFNTDFPALGWHQHFFHSVDWKSSADPSISPFCWGILLLTWQAKPDCCRVSTD